MRLWRSVRFKLALWYLAVLALGMIVFGVSSWVVLREVVLESQQGELDQKLAALEQFLSRESRGDDLGALREEAREYSTGLPDEQGLRVTTPSGETLFTRKPAPGLALQRSRSASVRGHTLLLELSSPQTELYKTLSTLAWVMVGVFPLVLVVAISGGWWLAKRALYPVGKMTRQAREISAHDLSSRLSIPDTGDELEELAVTWNELLGRIETLVKAVKRFTADAAHELRTPVTVVRTTAELALRYPRTEDGYRETLASIEQETVQMTELLDQMLLLARGDAGEWKFQLDTVFVDQVLRDVRNTLAPLADKSGVKIDWKVSKESVAIQADEKAIRRLILILVENAIKYTPAGGIVAVLMEARAAECTLEVRDTGTGIDPKHIAHIFERFYRGDAARASGVGSGLGLAIADAIVRAHGGRIEAASSEEGSRFLVTIPTDRQADAMEPAAEQVKVPM